MISFLRGILLEKHPNLVIVDVNGVGYELNIPVSTYSVLPETGREVKLRVHTHVREDALTLFGFNTTDEKALFEKLISVSGIGPRLAVNVLSGLAASDLVAAIRNGDVQQLVRIPGVGKKTAERIVLELKEKLEFVAGAAGAAVAAGKPRPGFSPSEEDVISALMNIGANRAAAEAAVLKARQETSDPGFDAMFRKALALLR
jgi:Holliday junction DNA helicase RuvA